MALGTQQRGSGVPIGNALLQRLQALENITGLNGAGARATSQQFYPPAPLTAASVQGTFTNGGQLYQGLAPGRGQLLEAGPKGSSLTSNGPGNPVSWLSQENIVIAGAFPQVFGNVPNPGDSSTYYINAGSVEVTTNGIGQGTVLYANAFLNGVVSLVCTEAGKENASDPSLNWVGQVFDITTTSFSFYLQNGTGAVQGLPTGNVTIWVNYIALGY